jgi:hypothetical protein
MAYNAWLAREKEPDDGFRIWRDTDDGKGEIEHGYSPFPGLWVMSMVCRRRVLICEGDVDCRHPLV